MLTTLSRRWFRYQFGRACHGVWNTPPLVIRPARLKWVSMICRRDLDMYLLAIKSAYTRIGYGSVVCLDDGTLTGDDRARLAEHLGNPEFHLVHDIQTGTMPKGGTWERLLTCIDLSADDYVIQVDCDTISHGDLAEIGTAIRENRSFTQGTTLGRVPVNCVQAAEFADGRHSEHVQILAERQMRNLTGSQDLHYVRGCSAFAGFSKGTHSRDRLEQFSDQMERLLSHETWRQWGSEQVSSNYVIANAPDPFILSPERYATNGWDSLADSVFVHFIGAHRFANGAYSRYAHGVITQLNGSTA